jgi:hypothetical protein
LTQIAVNILLHRIHAAMGIRHSLLERGLRFLPSQFSASQMVDIELQSGPERRFEVIEQRAQRRIDRRQHPPPVHTVGTFGFEDDAVADGLSADSGHGRTTVSLVVVRVHSPRGRSPVENSIPPHPGTTVFVESLVTAAVVEKHVVKGRDRASGTIDVIDASHGVSGDGTRGVPES